MHGEMCLPPLATPMKHLNTAVVRCPDTPPAKPKRSRVGLSTDVPIICAMQPELKKEIDLSKVSQRLQGFMRDSLNNGRFTDERFEFNYLKDLEVLIPHWEEQLAEAHHLKGPMLERLTKLRNTAKTLMRLFMATCSDPKSFGLQ